MEFGENLNKYKIWKIIILIFKKISSILMLILCDISPRKSKKIIHKTKGYFIIIFFLPNLSVDLSRNGPTKPILTNFLKEY